MNPLQKLLIRFPNGYWNRIEVSRNPNCDFAFFLRHPKFFDADAFSENPSLRWVDVQANRHLSWNYGSMAANPGLSLAMILSNLKLFYDMYPEKLSSHPDLTPQVILANPHLFWNVLRLTQNPGIRLADIDHLPETWQWLLPPFYRKSTWAELMDYGQPIPFTIALQNKNLRWRHFTQTRFTRYMTGVIDVNDPVAIGSQAWFVCQIPDIPLDVIRRYLDADSNLMWTIAKHPRMTLNKLRVLGIDFSHYIEAIVSNPNLTYEFVIENPDLPWAHQFQMMSWNLFKKDPVLRELSAEVIQRKWLAVRLRRHIESRIRMRRICVDVKHYPGRGVEYWKAHAQYMYMTALHQHS
jgi:hypothetical protein